MKSLPVPPAAPRGRRPAASTSRAAAAIALAAALALLAAACSSGPSSAGPGDSPSAGGSGGTPSAVAFSGCMRSHGVPNFPDPGGHGVLPKTSPQQLGVSSSQWNTAQRACQYLLPITSASIEQCEAAGICTSAITQEMLTDGLRFARCMRSHGVPNWPDPTADSRGSVAFAISVSRDGFDPHSPQIEAKVNVCDHLMPGGGVPLAVSS